MIAPKISRGLALEKHLLITAREIARARGSMIVASRQSEGAGWRNAPFLWPLIERSEPDGK